MEQLLVKSPDFKSYYVNNVRIGITSNDFNLICGLVNSRSSWSSIYSRGPIIYPPFPSNVKGSSECIDFGPRWMEKIFGKLPDLPTGILNTKGIQASLHSMEERVRALSDET